MRLAKSLYGIRYVPFVHDFIPVMAPEHCVAALRQDFITWAIGAFDHADFFLVNSKATLADLNMVCKKLGYRPRDAAVITLDADFRKTLGQDTIWDEVGDPADFLASLDLEKGKYVLFVSTIESRKNHIAAFSVWLKLIKKHGIKNVPKLVCVGNPGWLNDAAYAKLNASDLLLEHVLMLSKISDGALAVLYENSVCTLYPSSYEGWGLPVTEALCYGKVPIVSNVSSLPEAGGPFAEYFDVESEKDLMDAVERVVYDEKHRTRREQKSPGRVPRADMERDQRPDRRPAARLVEGACRRPGFAARRVRAGHLAARGRAGHAARVHEQCELFALGGPEKRRDVPQRQQLVVAGTLGLLDQEHRSGAARLPVQGCGGLRHRDLRRAQRHSGRLVHGHAEERGRGAGRRAADGGAGQGREHEPGASTRHASGLSSSR